MEKTKPQTWGWSQMPGAGGSLGGDWEHEQCGGTFAAEGSPAHWPLVTTAAPKLPLRVTGQKVCTEFVPRLVRSTLPGLSAYLLTAFFYLV